MPYTAKHTEFRSKKYVNTAPAYSLKWSGVCNMQPSIQSLMVRSILYRAQQTEFSSEEYVIYSWAYRLQWLGVCICQNILTGEEMDRYNQGEKMWKLMQM